MKRLQKFSRIFLSLRRGPQFKLPKRQLKLLLHQSKSATLGSIGDSWRSFRHRASLLFHRSKIPRPQEELANRRKLLKSLLKPPKGPLMEKSKAPSLLLYTLSRPKAKPDERVKAPNILVQTFRRSPHAPKDLGKSAREMWHGLRILMKKPVKAEAMDAKEVSRMEAVHVLWDKDTTALRTGVLEFKSKLGTLTRTHWKTALLLMVLVPTLFEIFLQSVAFMTWPLLGIGEKWLGHRPVVLCLGDSFSTGQFGGVSMRPYSSYLDGIVSKKEGGGWRVLHFGSEYLDSEVALNELPELLQKQRPDAVYIMIGVNDMLVHPSAKAESAGLRDAKQATRPRWLRSAILYHILRKHRSPTALLQIFNVPPAYALKQPVAVNYSDRVGALAGVLNNLLNISSFTTNFPAGTQWYYGGRPASFGTNGILDRAGTTQTYEIRGNLLIQPAGPQKGAFLWETTGDALLLSGQTLAETFAYTRNLRTTQDAAARAESERSLAWINLQNAALKPAMQHFTAAISADRDDALSHAGLAEVFFRSNSDLQAKKEIGWLQKKYQGDPNPENARALMHAFPFEHSPPENFKMALLILKNYPANPWYWQTLSWNAFLSGRSDIAEKSIVRALALAPQQMPRLRATLLRTQAIVTVSSKPDAALQSLFSAFLLDHDENQLIENLKADAPDYLRANLQKVLNANPQARFKLSAIVQSALDNNAADSLLLFEKRLAAIVQLCQEYSAKPVLVGYPVAYEGLDETMRRVALANDASFINVQEKFDAVRKNEKRQYQKDYRFGEQDSQRLAQWVADDLQQRKPQ